MIGGRDSILQAGMVGQGNVEAGHTGLHQQRYKDTQFAFQYTGIAVVGVLLPDSQFVVDGQLRQTAAHGAHSFNGKAGAVFGAAAVGIGAVVEHAGAETAAHTVAVDLHHVEPGFYRQLGGLAKAVDDLIDLALRQIGDIRGHFLVEQGAQLLHRDFLRQNARHIFEHGCHVGV